MFYFFYMLIHDGFFSTIFSGLERVAEELMGRRKWKQYQDLIQRSNLNIDATNLTQKTSLVGKCNFSIMKIKLKLK